MVVWLLIVAVTSCVVCWNDGMLMLVDVVCWYGCECECLVVVCVVLWCCVAYVWLCCWFVVIGDGWLVG